MVMDGISTTDRIRAAILELLKEKSINDIKVTHVVNKLGMSRGTFYNYYDSVYAVLQEIEDDFFDDMQDALHKTNHVPFDDRYFDMPSPMVLDLLTFVHRHQDVYSSLLAHGGDDLFSYRIAKLARENIIDRAFSEGYIKVDRKFLDASRAFTNAGHLALLSYLSEGNYQATDDEMAVLIYRLLFGAYRSHWMDS